MVVLADLLEDGNPNSSLERDLVPDVDTFEAWRTGRTVGSATEKTGKGIPDGLRSLN